MTVPPLQDRLVARLESMSDSAAEEYYKAALGNKKWYYEKGVSETLLAVLRMLDEETNPVILKKRYGDKDG